jgi:hypothetical protein
LDPDELNADTDQYAIFTGVTGSADYFISYKTRLQVDARILYGYNSGGEYLILFPNLLSTTAETSGFNARLSASLVVSIF